MTYNVFSGTLNPTQSINGILSKFQGQTVLDVKYIEDNATFRYSYC